MKNEPAFPLTSDAISHTNRDFNMQGMTLRDYFAAKALSGQIAYTGLEGCGADEGARDVAIWAYEMADAMLKAREPK